MYSVMYMCESHAHIHMCTHTHSHYTHTHTGGIDFPYFRKLHEELTAQCALWRAKNEALERETKEDGENGSHLEEGTYYHTVYLVHV